MSTLRAAAIRATVANDEPPAPHPVHTLLSPLPLLVAAAFAADTGDLRGRVVDAEGIGVPGVAVTVSGQRSSQRHYTTTDDLGRFRVRELAPGTYRLDTEHSVASDLHVDVVVRADRVTEVPLTLDIGGSDTLLTVVDQVPVLDMRTSSVSTALGSEALANLPVRRDIYEIAQTLPGITAQFGTAPSARGEGSLGNNVRVDGLSTRDPYDHSLAQTVNFDAIEEIQVYTDGAPAELGPFSGMLVNLVTKSGGDEHRGMVRAQYTQHAHSGAEFTLYDPDSEATSLRSRRRLVEPLLSATASGPGVPNRLWYFAALQLSRRSLRPEGRNSTQTTQDGSLFLKLNWKVNDQLDMQYVGTAQPTATSNLFTGDDVANEAQSDATGLSTSHLIEATFGLSGSTLVDLRGGYTRRTRQKTPSSDDLLTGAWVDADGTVHGNALTSERRASGRLGGGVTLTHYVDDVAGDHRFRFGTDAWLLTFSERVTHTGLDELAWIDSGGAVGEARNVGTVWGSSPGWACEAPDHSDCGQRLHYNNVGRVRNRVSTWALFAQDDWSVRPDLHLNLGLRLDLEEGRTSDGRVPRGMDVRVMPAPRLGLAYDVLDEGNTKLYANLGRYFDLAGGAFWARSNSQSADALMAYDRAPNGEWTWQQTTDPSAERTHDLRPERTDRLVLGVSQRMPLDTILGVRAVRASTRHIPQEQLQSDGSVLVTSGNWRRDYRAFELWAQRAWLDSGSFWASYTLSQSEGHVDNTLNSVPLGVEQPYGALATDITHQLRLNGAWTFPFGSTAGLVYAFDSGRAISRRTFVSPYGYVGYGYGRGTERTQATHRVDLRLAHSFLFGDQGELELSLDVFNLIGSEVPVVVVTTDTDAFGQPLVRQDPRQVRLSGTLRW